jgi:hypothetical protein
MRRVIYVQPARIKLWNLLIAKCVSIDEMSFSNLEHYMTEVVSSLELRIGLPSTKEKEDYINQKAIEWDLSIQAMRKYDFEDIFQNIMMRKRERNFFDLCFQMVVCEEVTSPKVTLESYIFNNVQYPKIVIHGDYLDKVMSDGRIWVNDEIISRVGKVIEDYFDYEFVNFLRVRQ